MYSSGWPASEGVSFMVETPSLPWQAAQSCAFALPAAALPSCARAGVQATANKVSVARRIDARVMT